MGGRGGAFRGGYSHVASTDFVYQGATHTDWRDRPADPRLLPDNTPTPIFHNHNSMSKGTSGMLLEAPHFVAPRAASLPLGDAKVNAESVREKEREREMHLTEEDKDILARAKAIEQRHSRRTESALEYDRFLTPRMEERQFRREADVGVGVGVGMGREGGGSRPWGGGGGASILSQPRLFKLKRCGGCVARESVPFLFFRPPPLRATVFGILILGLSLSRARALSLSLSHTH